MSHRLARLFAVLFVAVTALSIVMPLAVRSAASAQSFPEDESGPVIRWIQGSSAADVVEFFGQADFRGSEGRAFANVLMESMAIDTTAVELKDPDYDSEEDLQLVAYLDDHWLREASAWRGSIDMQKMANAVIKQGYATFEIDICPVMEADVDYTREPDDEYDGCKSWTIGAGATRFAAGQITVQENPNDSGYNRVLLFTVIGTLIGSALLAGGTIWLRRASLKTLDTSNMVVCLVAVFSAGSAVTITACVFGFGVSSVDEALLANAWGWREHALLVLLPAFVTAVPFLLSAILIVCANPRPLNQQPSVVGGVPYWMTAPQTQPNQQQQSQAPQQPPAQPWAPPQGPQQPAPPHSSPSSTNPWDPPA